MTSTHYSTSRQTLHQMTLSNAYSSSSPKPSSLTRQEDLHEAVEVPHVHLAAHFKRCVHAEQRDAEVDDLHILSGHEAADGAASADIDLGGLGLPGDGVAVEQAEDAGGEFGVGVKAASVALDGDAVADAGGVGLFTGLREDGIDAVIGVSRDDLRVAQGVAQIEIAVLVSALGGD